VSAISRKYDASDNVLAEIVSSFCSRLHITCLLKIVPSVESANRGEGFEEWLGEDEGNNGVVRRVGKTVSSTFGMTLETASCTACRRFVEKVVGEYGGCGLWASVLAFSVGLEGQCTGGERTARLRIGDKDAELVEAV
jgi:hypothetical protein